MRLDQKIAEIAKMLDEDGIATARLDARLLVCHGLGLSETDLILQFDRQISDQETGRIDDLVERRLRREPIAHILGVREFWGLPFHVTPDTLVPRPDSETLISGVLNSIQNTEAAYRIVDIGTGSGCLLLALLSELPNAFGVGVDISEAALAVARRNAQDLGFSERVSFVQGDYAHTVTPDIDILISNPPYLAASEVDDLEKDVAENDPHHALVSGKTGLEAYHSIFKTVGAWKTKPAVMAFEFGYRQAKDICDLAQQYALSDDLASQMSVLTDLAGHERVLLVRKIPAISA